MNRTLKFLQRPSLSVVSGLLMLVSLGCQDISEDVVTSQEVGDQEIVIDTSQPTSADEVDDTADEISSDRQAELTELAQEWVETRDDTLIQQIQNETELRFVEDLLQQWQDEETVDTGNTSTDPPPPPMAGCGGYWGTQASLSSRTTFAELKSVSYVYYWSPNCYMSAPGDDCGTDHNDNMVSFWMGPDYTTDETAYKTNSANAATYLDLLYHGGGSYRVYTSNAYGAWYGNAYVCLSKLLDASTLRFGRDY